MPPLKPSQKAKVTDALPVFNFEQPFPLGRLTLGLSPHGLKAFIGDENASSAPAFL
jgi:hypothetical protein